MLEEEFRENYFNKINKLFWHICDPSPYNVVLDELLVAQEDLLPAEDGGLGPGAKGSGAGVHSCQHLLLCSFRNTSHHFISGLQNRTRSIKTIRQAN